MRRWLAGGESIFTAVSVRGKIPIFHFLRRPAAHFPFSRPSTPIFHFPNLSNFPILSDFAEYVNVVEINLAL